MEPNQRKNVEKPRAEKGPPRPMPVCGSGVIFALTTTAPGNRNSWPPAAVINTAATKKAHMRTIVLIL